MQQLPKSGEYYYHFKHDENVVNDHAYYVVGLAKHTENDEILVIYKALYNVEWLKNDVLETFSARPLTMWLDMVDKPEYNYKGCRFTLITDSSLIEQLKKF